MIDLPISDKESTGTTIPRIQQPLGQRSFWWAIAVCLIGGSLSFLVTLRLEDLTLHTASEITSHIATAFIVALILLLVLDFNARRAAHREMVQYRDLIAKDVFGAVLRRMVPDPLFGELVSLMRSEVVKRDCSYAITLKQPTTDLPRNQMLVERKTTFTVHNLASYKVEYLLRSEAPIHLELKVNDREVLLEDGRNLRREARHGQMVLEHRIPLEANGTATVYLAGLEIRAIEADFTNVIQSTAVLGLTISVRNEYPERVLSTDVDMIHPGRAQLQLDDLGFYHFKRAILPGQGFQISWRARTEDVALGGDASAVEAVVA